MSATVLSQASAFNPGAELWVLPRDSQSRWAPVMDWYLNFQITKAQRHQSLQISSFLEFIENETQLNNPKPTMQAQAPLLIASGELLPNRWMLCLDLDNQFEKWVEQISQTWEGLNHPSLRIFLPPGQNAGSFDRIWHKLQKFNDYTLVLD